MKKKEKNKFKGPMIVFGIFVFISLFWGIIQLISFVFLLREIPDLLDLFLLK